MIQWAAMHAAWSYSRFQVHASLKVTPFQSLFGRPYRGRIVLGWERIQQTWAFLQLMVKA